MSKSGSSRISHGKSERCHPTFFVEIIWASHNCSGQRVKPFEINRFFVKIRWKKDLSLIAEQIFLYNFIWSLDFFLEPSCHVNSKFPSLYAIFIFYARLFAFCFASILVSRRQPLISFFGGCPVDCWRVMSFDNHVLSVLVNRPFMFSVWWRPILLDLFVVRCCPSDRSSPTFVGCFSSQGQAWCNCQVFSIGIWQSTVCLVVVLSLRGAEGLV